MSWLILGFLATMLFGIVSLADKFALSRFFKNNWSYPFFTSFFFGLYCSIILIFRILTGQFYSPSIGVTLLALLPGMTLFTSGLFFTRAMMKMDASIVTGVSQINVLFALMWGWLFLGEIYQPINYAGVVLIVFSAILLSLERNPDHQKKFKVSAVLLLIILGTLFRSLSDLFIKLALSDLAFWDAFSLSRAGLLLAAFAIFCFPSIRAQITNPVREHGKKVIFIAGFIEMFAFLNSMLMVLAFSLGPLGLVSTTQATLPLFVLVFTLIINFFKPGLIPVRKHAVNNLIKALLSLAIIGGVYFVYQYL